MFQTAGSKNPVLRSQIHRLCHMDTPHGTVKNYCTSPAACNRPPYARHSTAAGPIFRKKPLSSRFHKYLPAFLIPQTLLVSVQITLHSSKYHSLIFCIYPTALNPVHTEAQSVSNFQKYSQFCRAVRKLPTLYLNA